MANVPAEISNAVQSVPLLGTDDTRPLEVHLVATVLVGVCCTVVWAATGAPGNFWPFYVWQSGVLAVLVHVIGRRHVARLPNRWRWPATQLELSVVVVGLMLSIWLLPDGGGYFWPFWVAFGLAIALAIAVLVALSRDDRALAQRVGILERTRRGALDVQAAELRRIERDLHDGAQARLVALTMQLGRAEARLDESNPEVAELVRTARDEAYAAIAELRDLARGIAPPVLADRGLVAAVEALGKRSGIPVRLFAEIEQRPLPVVETAAYFVVAEALTNVAKHAPGASAEVRLAQRGEDLVVSVSDDGPGGARADLGSGLAGLRQRTEALDGTLTVSSPSGGPTTITAVLPCAS
ncbi:MAG TPA: sensor histidine kinase [Solirubrobacteraceae bacterium]